MKSSKLYLLIFSAVLTVVFFLYIKCASQPLLDLHSFRQTQTAITAYYTDFHDLKKSLFFYETPILGYPWTIPFEFPLFQILAAGIHSLTGISLDISGRLLSALLYLLCFIPLYKIIKELKLSEEYFYISALLLLLSPLYFYWSRAFMIESSALLTGASFLWCSIKYFNTLHLRWVLGMLVFGVLCTLIKITTFPSFVIAAFFALLFLESGTISLVKFKKYLIEIIPLVCVVVFCFFILELWTHHADALKAKNNIGKVLTSVKLQKWNFGTLSQRISCNFWKEAFLDRILPHSIGSSYAFFIIILGFFFASKKQKWGIALLLILFLVPLLVFTNLHIIHDYYQYANSFWLILCLALSLYIIRKKHLFFYLILFIFIGSSDIYQISHHYYKQMKDILHSRSDDSNEKRLEIAAKVRAITPKNSLIIVLGEGWGAEIPYYSKRKAIMLSGLISSEQSLKMLQDPQVYNGLPVSAIIVNKKELLLEDEALLSTLLNTHPDLNFVTPVGYFDLYTHEK